MFLEDKLEEIQAQDIPVSEKASQFLKAMTENLENTIVFSKKGTTTPSNIANSIKRIDATWKKFAQKYNYKVDFWRVQSSDSIKKMSMDIYNLLGW